MKRAVGVAVPIQGQHTAWELLQIKNNPDDCKRTTFYEVGIIKSDPAKKEICGG